MKYRNGVVAIVAILVTACASTPAIRVGDAQGVESVSALSMGCKKPFALTQDCSGMSGPTKKITIKEQKLKVAGNETGTVTVVFGPSSLSANTEAVNLGYELMKRELVGRGYTIVKVTPIESAGSMFGYSVETDKPHYAIWQEFVVDK